jgi:hypothetical protein
MEFKQLNCDGSMDVVVGQTTEQRIAISEEPPMNIGLFALLILPLRVQEHDTILHGLSDVLASSLRVFSHCFSGIPIDYSPLRQENNILQVLRFHFKMGDLLSIFKHLKMQWPILLGSLSGLW